MTSSGDDKTEGLPEGLPEGIKAEMGETILQTERDMREGMGEFAQMVLAEVQKRITASGKHASVGLCRVPSEDEDWVVVVSPELPPEVMDKLPQLPENFRPVARVRVSLATGRVRMQAEHGYKQLMREVAQEVGPKKNRRQRRAEAAEQRGGKRG